MLELTHSFNEIVCTYKLWNSASAVDLLPGKMKHVAIVFGIFLLCLNPTFQIPQFRDCSFDIIESMQDGCGTVWCYGEYHIAVSCGVWLCLDEPMSHIQQNNSKPHPACCSGPVCKKELMYGCR